MLRIHLLGTLILERDGKPLPPFKSRKVLGLLAYLATNPGAHSRSRLAGLLWSDIPEAKALNNLRFALWNMNQVLGVTVVQADRLDVAWSPPPTISLDIDEFTRITRTTRHNSGPNAIAKLEHAVNLYRGDFLASFDAFKDTLFAEWLEQQRAALRELAIGALYVLAHYSTTHCQLDRAIAFTQRLLTLDPWREASHAQLMLTLALAGKRDAALGQYEICRRMLAEELGTGPSVETCVLHDRILANEIAVSPTDEHPKTVLHFAGRGEEYAALLHEWQASQHGAGKLTLVEGEAGSGKTRLVEEVMHHIAGLGARVLLGELVEALSHKGWTLYRLGRTHSALQVGEEILGISTTLVARSTQTMGLSLRLVCAACMQLSRFDQAQAYMERALRLHRDTGDREGESQDLNTLGEIARLRGDFRCALDYYTESLNITRELHHPIPEAVRRNNRAGALVGLGEYALAETELVALLDELPDTPLLMETYRFYAEALWGQGKVAQAMQAARHSLDMAQTAKQKDVLASIWRVLGEILGAGNFEPSQIDLPFRTSQECFAESVRLCEETGMESEKAWTLFAWARHRMYNDDCVPGMQLQNQAKEIAARLGMLIPAPQ